MLNPAGVGENDCRSILQKIPQMHKTESYWKQDKNNALDAGEQPAKDMCALQSQKLIQINLFLGAAKQQAPDCLWQETPVNYRGSTLIC